MNNFLLNLLLIAGVTFCNAHISRIHFGNSVVESLPSRVFGKVLCVALVAGSDGWFNYRHQVAADTLESPVCRNDTANIGTILGDFIKKLTNTGQSLLFAAVSAGDVAAATALDAAGAVWKDGEVSKLLKKALDTGSPAIIEALAKSGVDFASFRDSNGYTYLHLAAEKGKADIVEAMLDGGLDIDCKGSGVVTALHLASNYGHLSTVQLLLLRGAAVNAGDSVRETPLHFAAANGHTEVIEALCAAGAEVNKRDLMNRTPLRWALLNNRTEAVILLRSKGGCE